MDIDKANKPDKSLILYKSESGTTFVIEVLTISNVYSLQLGAYMPGYFFIYSSSQYKPQSAPYADRNS